MKKKVSLVKCSTYDAAAVDKAVRQAVDLIGGIQQYVKPGERILVKPNLLSAREPERCVTTHPEVVRVILRLVREAGATPLLGDSPGGAVKGVERVWENTGMKKLAREENVELVNFETYGAVEKPVNHPLIPSVHIARITQDVDGIINLPKLKTHGFLIYTGAIKNFYGCIPGLRKAEYHKMSPYPADFSKLISEIYLLLKNKVRFNLIDGIIGMEGNGPSAGELRNTEMILASADAVSLDMFATSLMGLKPAKIDYIRYLTNNKQDEYGFDKIDVLGNTPADFQLNNFKIPSNWYVHFVPKLLIKFLTKHIWMKPAILPDTCKNCLMCVNSCPVKAIKTVGSAKPVVSHDECISCLCCHELCQFDAIELKSSLLIRLLNRN